MVGTDNHGVLYFCFCARWQNPVEFEDNSDIKLLMFCKITWQFWWEVTIGDRAERRKVSCNTASSYNNLVGYADGSIPPKEEFIGQGGWIC